MKLLMLVPFCIMASLPMFTLTESPLQTIPAVVKKAFIIAHPNARPKWENEGSDYEASFTEAGKKMSCVLNSSGKILETETVIPVTELPIAVRTYITDNYKGKKVSEAAIIVKADGSTCYEAEIGGKDMFFSADGKPITLAKK